MALEDGLMEATSIASQGNTVVRSEVVALAIKHEVLPLVDLTESLRGVLVKLLAFGILVNFDRNFLGITSLLGLGDSHECGEQGELHLLIKNIRFRYLYPFYNTDWTA